MFKQLIIDCHLSQSEAASLIGVGLRTIERWASLDSAPEPVIKAIVAYKAEIKQLRAKTARKAAKHL